MTALLLALILSSLSMAQDQAQEPARTPLEHTIPVDARTSEPVRAFSLRMGFRAAPIQAQSEVEFQWHSGNTWNPMVAVDYGTVAEPAERPSYAEDPSRYKVYSADAVTRGGVLRFTQKTGKMNEVSVTLNVFQLEGGDQIIDRATSDDFIEWVHQKTGHNDPFERQQNTLNVGSMHFIDRNGREYRVKEGQVFFGTFDISDVQYFNLVKNDRVLVTANVGGHIGIPLNGMNPYLALGGSAGLANTVRVINRHSVTLAVGGTLQHNRVAQMLPKSLEYFDRDWTHGYRVVLAHNIDFKNGHRYSTSLEFQGMMKPVLLGDAKGPIYPTWIDPTNETLRTPFNTPQYSEGEGHSRTSTDMSAGNLTRGTEYFSFNFSYRFGAAGKAPTVSLYFQEDWKYLVEYDNGPILFYGGENGQDYGAGFKLTVPVGVKLKKRKQP